MSGEVVQALWVGSRLSSMEQLVIAHVLTDHQVLVAIVLPVPVDVVDDRSFRQLAPAPRD